MNLYLVQHGKAFNKENDPEKSLNAEGMKMTDFMAGLSKEKNFKINRILHSGKKRSLQTAEIFQKKISKEIPLTEVTDLSPKDSPEKFLKSWKFESDTMIVGHLPFLEKLLSLLVINKTEPLIMKFQNSGIICLEIEAKEGTVSNAYIKWALMPEII